MRFSKPASILSVALLIGAALVGAGQPASAFGGGAHGGGGHGGMGGGFGHMGGNRGGAMRITSGRQGFQGAGGFGFRDGRPRGGYGFGQNGDALSDYAPYGRPVYGCDPTTPSRAHPGCF